MATQAQILMLRQQRTICQTLHIVQSTFGHRRMRGSLTTPNSQGNVVYQSSGIITDITSLFETTTLVWWSNMPFLRGEQRQEEAEIGLYSVPILQSQIPAIDDAGHLLVVEEGDAIVDPQGAIWRIANPSLTPDQALWAFMATCER